MSVAKAQYGTRTAFPNLSNLNSMAAGNYNAIGAVDNSATLAEGYKIDLNITLNSAGVSSTGTLVLYLLESTDGTTYTDNLSATGTGLTIKNAKPIRVLNANANSQVVVDSFDLPCPIPPYKFALVLYNGSGAALPSSGNNVNYTPFNRQFV